MNSALEKMQQVIVQRLQRQIGHEGAVVLARRAADLDSQIEAAIQSATGLTLIVLDPLPHRVAPEVPGPVFLEIALTVRVIENLLSNETGPKLIAAAERTSQALHLWPLPAPCRDGVLRLAETKGWTMPADPRRGAVTMDLHFVATGSLVVPELR